MDPRTRVSFQYREKNIECFLQSGQSFKVDSVDTYLILPKSLYVIIPKERKPVVATVQKHQGDTTD